eukprot:470888_1
MILITCALYKDATNRCVIILICFSGSRIFDISAIMTLLLQYVFIATAFIHLSLAQLPSSTMTIQSLQLRYVVDNDNDFDQFFALPIDECIKVSILQEKYVRYTCSNLGVEKRLYDGDGEDCGSLIPDQSIEYWTEDDKSPCGGDKFSCTGDDRWVMLGFYLASCGAKTILDIPVVMGCFCGTTTTSYEATCGKVPLSGEMVYHTGTNCSAVDNTTDLSQCTFATSQQGADIYSQIVDCRLTDPTPSPTTEPTLAPTVNNPLAIKGLDDIYKAIVLIFVATFFLIGSLSLIDAWFVRPNDYFKIGALGSMTIQTVDMISDCFFSAEVIRQYGLPEQASKNKTPLLVIFLLSVLFIALPALLALFQLYSQAKKHWLKSDYVRSWLSKYFTILLFVSIASGSSFAAVALLNSYIFHLEIFDMGLTDKQMKRFNTRRIWSIVVFENCPQLLLQSAFLILQGGSIFTHLITVSSMAMSLVSIIISIMSMTMERAINKTQRSVTISMDVTGECVELASGRCRTMNLKLRKNLGPLLKVDWNIIEVVKPMYVDGGLSVDIIVYINKGFETWDKVLAAANASGKLPRIYVDAWKLEGNPVILNIRIKLTESKEDFKTRVASEAQDGDIVAGFKPAMSISERSGRVPSAHAPDQSGSNFTGGKVTPIAEEPKATATFEGAAKAAKTHIEMAETDAPPPVYNPDARLASDPRRKASDVTGP